MILKSFLFLHFKPYLKLTAHILKKQKGFKGFKGTDGNRSLLSLHGNLKLR